MPEQLYLATRPNGHLGQTDRLAQPGAVLRAIEPLAPFRTKRLLAGKLPEQALANPAVDWPCALWLVRGEGGEKEPSGLCSYAEMTVVEQLDSALALGPTSEKLQSWFQRLRDFRVSDVVSLGSNADDEWWKNSGEDTAPDESPAYQAGSRAIDLTDQEQRRGVYAASERYARAQEQLILKPFFDIALQGSPYRKADNPYAQLEHLLSSAIYDATRAFVVADSLDVGDYALLTDDWLRLTGQQL